MARCSSCAWFERMTVARRDGAWVETGGLCLQARRIPLFRSSARLHARPAADADVGRQFGLLPSRSGRPLASQQAVHLGHNPALVVLSLVAPVGCPVLPSLTSP